MGVAAIGSRPHDAGRRVLGERPIQSQEVGGIALCLSTPAHARRWTLHLPAGWPWAAWFELALARLRCVAYAT